MLTVRDYDPEKGPFLPAYRFELRRAYQIAKWGGRGERFRQDPLNRADCISLDAPAADDSETPLVELIADTRDIFTATEDRERAQAVQTALATLPEGERAVIICIFFYGMTQDAAAAALQISTAEVKKTEAAALRKLRHPNVSRMLRAYL